ncbi:diguanylate cyclase domain-containing protein [Rossellomorea vietnamensis]|uniref:diguanylate cyclase domain-containing protein n=1 Tax=Rossellomorea vietnamensis TaxID=218284 RepID=UPI003CE7239A
MKETTYIRNALFGLAFFVIIFCGGILTLDGEIKALGVSAMAAAAIVFTLLMQILAVRRTEGLQRRFIGLLLLATILYAAAEVVWFYEEKLAGGLDSVPLWSNILYILNLLSYIAAFSLLTFAIKNRYQVVYFAIDILIIYFSVTAILWVYWLHPLYEEAGVAYGPGVTSFIYPALELLLLFALSATMFLKRYFFPLKTMLLLIFSIALFFISDTMHLFALYYGRFEPNSLLEVMWSSAIVLQGIAALQLYLKRSSFRRGENTFHYEAGSYPVARSIVNIGSILILFLIFTASQDLTAGAGLLVIIFLVYSRQLLASSQLNQMTLSYQELARDLENQVDKRTEELRRKNAELEQSSSRLKYMALHDQLTDIWNRRALEGRLKTLFEKSLDEKEVKFALIFIDIDKFKEINDRLGHSYGDELLVEFTMRIKQVFPQDAFIARQSGDEFVVILEEWKLKKEIEFLIQKFFEANQKGYSIYGEEVNITFSLGASFFPEDSRNADELLQAADMAMYAVKQQGKNNYQFH